MLDINFIRENKDLVEKATRNKQLDPAIVGKVLELDKKRRELIQEVESSRSKKRQYSAETVRIAQEIAKNKKDQYSPEVIKRARKELERKKNYSPEVIKRALEILKEREPELSQIEKEYKKALFEIPNPPAPDVKEGKDDTENEVIRKYGEPKKFGFKVKDHLELGKALGIIDVARAAKVSGARFGYLKGNAVLLEFAIVNFAIETLSKEGFVPVIPPVLIKTDSMKGMGYMEHGGDEQMYILDKDGLVLVGTSEQSLGPMHMGEVIDAKNLPLRYMGFSTCFRREAGTYGKDTRGILRVHQFDKVEMVSFTKPEDSDKEHEFLLDLEEKFLQALELPYQVVKMCSGDLGAPAARKYDLEAWIPSQDRYRELTSTSTCTDFQARRLNIKYLPSVSKSKDPNVQIFETPVGSQYVHTLNGTAFAIGRTIIAILENYQQKDGSVIIPEVLRKWMGKNIIVPRV